MKKLFIFSPLFLLTFYSCKKDNVNQIQNSTVYLPLKTGNYWIYDDYKQDSSGSFSILSGTDSIYISGDTTIGNNTFSIMRDEFVKGRESFYRDSSGYLVNQNGRRFFSTDNFTDTLSSYYADSPINKVYVSRKMEDQDFSISVPAGTFGCLNSKEYIYLDSAYQDNFRTEDHYYSENVGIIKEGYQFIVSEQKHELRLVSYHVQ